VADNFGVNRTNEIYVLDSKRRILYHGAIDDQYGIGYQRASAEHEYLIDALTQILAGEKVAVAQTQGIGCLVGRELTENKVAKITFHNQVERIFQQNCQSCHREGQIGPFVLKTYKDAKGWASMIQEVVSNKRMPPWLASKKYGHFVNDRSLSQQEADTIVAWVDAGAPEGDVKDAPLPVEFPTGWVIGQPDAILELPVTYEVPAEGTVPYQHFQVKTDFDEDKWVIAGEIQPGDPSVVHHVLTFVVPPMSDEEFAEFSRENFDNERAKDRAKKTRKELIAERKARIKKTKARKSKSGGVLPDGVGNFIVNNQRKRERNDLSFREGISFFIGNVPGTMPQVYPEGTAKLLPKGSSIIFQMHYTPNGKKAFDKTKLGLKFAKTPPKHVLRTASAVNFRFEIPPNDAHHRVGATMPIKRDMKLVALTPHMHLRGKAFKYEMEFPDGKTQTLLEVPRYDFGWQIRYVLAKPLFVPKGSRLFCSAVFDNSPDNPWNPDPNETVYWGDQTWEEMMIGFYDYIDMSPVDADRQVEKKADARTKDHAILAEPQAAAK